MATKQTKPLVVRAGNGKTVEAKRKTSTSKIPHAWFENATKISHLQAGVFITILLAAILCTLCISFMVITWRRGDTIYNHFNLLSNDPLRNEAINRAIELQMKLQADVCSFTEKMGIAVISLLSAVLGYTLKGSGK